jgi:glycosyltransferase involved in cell wall biosynthesis/SAM-dependent methyltransferase
MEFKLLAHSEHQDWTGERFIVDRTGEIEFEHHHRYLFATQFCEDRDVLDIASGEGYGSHLLSQVARTVVGVDIDSEVVAHAQHVYGGTQMRFAVGSCQSIPLDKASVDVVVSFETLEHISEHETFLDEVKRVLRPGGLLVLSTPDREVYSSPDKPDNPFHLLELSRDEFSTLLTKRFAHSRVGIQKATSGSVVLPYGESAEAFEVFRRADDVTYDRTSDLSLAPYLIAISSDGELPPVRWGLLDNPDFLTGIQVRVMDTEALLNSEVGRLEAEILRLNEAFSERDNEVKRVNEAFSERDNEVKRVNEAYEELQASERTHRSLNLSHMQANNLLGLSLAHANFELRAERHRSAKLEERAHELSKLAQELQQVYTSTSWRVTRPIRAAKLVLSRSGWRRLVRSGNVASSGDSPMPAATSPVDRQPFLLIATHDCTRTGGPLLCLNLARELAGRSGMRLVIVALNGGELEPEFAKIAPFHILNRDALMPSPEAALRETIARLDGPVWGAICNTVVTAGLVEVLDSERIPVVSLVHELPTSISTFFGRDAIDKINAHAQHVVYGSSFVCDRVVQAFGSGVAQKHVIPTGHFVPTTKLEDRYSARAGFIADLNIPSDALLVFGCGPLNPRKGPDVFAQVAALTLRQRPDLPLHFVWIGSEDDAGYASWLRHDVSQLGLDGRLHLVGGRTDADACLGAADVFLLTSREDPYPLINLAAMAKAVPVIAFGGAGGAPEALGDEAGVTVPYLDIASMTRTLIELAEDAPRRAALGTAGRRRFLELFTIDVYADRLLGLLPQSASITAAVVGE